MTEERVPAAGSEGASTEEPTSQQPGTPQPVTRDEVQQLVDQAIQRAYEQGRSQMQGQKDREIAEMRREQQEQEDDYYEEALPAQAGSYQQPQVVWDPVTQQWVQMQQPAPQPQQQRRRRRPSQTDRRVAALEAEVEERKRQEERARYIDNTLRSAGLTYNDLDPDSYSTQQTFTAEVNRVKARRDEAERTRLVGEAIAKKEAEIARLTREKLQAEIQAGGLDAFMSAGPSVTPSGQDELRKEYETRRQAIIANPDTSTDQRSIAVTMLEEEMAERGLE